MDHGGGARGGGASLVSFLIVSLELSRKSDKSPSPHHLTITIIMWLTRRKRFTSFDKIKANRKHIWFIGPFKINAPISREIKRNKKPNSSRKNLPCSTERMKDEGGSCVAIGSGSFWHLLFINLWPKEARPASFWVSEVVLVVIPLSCSWIPHLAIEHGQRGGSKKKLSVCSADLIHSD